MWGRRRAPRVAWWNMLAWLYRGELRLRWMTGALLKMKAGDLFYIAPGHDSWVVGDQPYVSLHFMGAAQYAVQKK